ncbi:MAG: hypothetical protein HY360_07995 [Verrucomicrobia bacterium]|nr:hypothetical protein [Verrucomicrobiota bacterium]
MNFIKKNVLLLAMFLAFFALLAVSLYFLKNKIAERGEVESDLDAKITARAQLWNRRPAFPSKKNVEIVCSNVVIQTALVAEVLKPLRQVQFSFDILEGLTAQNEINITCRRLSDMLKERQVKHPDKFQFGFGRYTPYPPKKQDTPMIQKQLRLVEELIKLAANAPFHELISFRRVEFEDAHAAAPAKSRNPQEEPLISMGGEFAALDLTGSGYLYAIMPFEMEFWCVTDSLRKFLNDLAASPNIFLPRIMNIENEKKEPMSGSQGAAAAAVTRPAAVLAPVAAPPRGMAFPASKTGAATNPIEKPRVDPTQLPFVMGQERIKVGMRIEWLEFRPPPPPGRKSQPAAPKPPTGDKKTPRKSSPATAPGEAPAPTGDTVKPPSEQQKEKQNQTPSSRRRRGNAGGEEEL